MGHPTLAPSNLFSVREASGAGTEENRALVAPGLKAVKHNSYREDGKTAYIGPKAQLSIISVI